MAAKKSWIVLLSDEYRDEDPLVEKNLRTWLKNWAREYREVPSAPSRLEFLARGKSDILHFTFTRLDGLFHSRELPNFAYVGSRFFQRRPPARGWIDRANALRGIFVVDPKVKARLQKHGVRCPIWCFSLLRRDSFLRPLAAALDGTREPLYVEISQLRKTPFTGVQRLLLRLVQSLAKDRALRLGFANERGEFSVVSEIGPGFDDEPGDLDQWGSSLAQGQPRRLSAADRRLASVLYTFGRPAKRIFAREFGILYDLTPLTVKTASSPLDLENFQSLYFDRLPLCDRLIAISRSTRQDADWLLPGVADRVHVASPGPSQCLTAHAGQASPLKRERAILVVSTLSPHKNAAFAMKWFNASTAVPAKYEMWWVGGKHVNGDKQWMLEVAEALLRARTRRISLQGRVSDAKLCELYRRARVTLFPSLYEGFGFPVLDSLWHGTPVVCGYHSSLKEFERPGVFFFDLGDPSSLDRAVKSALGFRRDKIKQSRLAEDFNWQNMGRRITGDEFRA